MDGSNEDQLGDHTSRPRRSAAAKSSEITKQMLAITEGLSSNTHRIGESKKTTIDLNAKANVEPEMKSSMFKRNDNVCRGLDNPLEQNSISTSPVKPSVNATNSRKIYWVKKSGFRASFKHSQQVRNRTTVSSKASSSTTCTKTRSSSTETAARTSIVADVPRPLLIPQLDYSRKKVTDFDTDLLMTCDEEEFTHKQPDQSQLSEPVQPPNKRYAKSTGTTLINYDLLLSCYEGGESELKHHETHPLSQEQQAQEQAEREEEAEISRRVKAVVDQGGRAMRVDLNKDNSYLSPVRNLTVEKFRKALETGKIVYTNGRFAVKSLDL